MSGKSDSINLGEILHGKVYDQYNDLIIRLKRGSLVGSYSVAKQTALLLRLVVGHTRWENVEMLIQIVRALGRGLVSAQPVELAVGNIVRRILFIVRQEYERLVKERNEIQGPIPPLGVLPIPPLEGIPPLLPDRLGYTKNLFGHQCWRQTACPDHQFCHQMSAAGTKPRWPEKEPWWREVI